MPGRRPRAGGARRRAAAVLGALVAALAFAAPASAAKPTYGVVPQDGIVPSVHDLELMPEGGVQSIRLMAHWPSAEPVRGVYDWSSLDAMVRETSNRGVQPLLFLYGTPDWAAKLDDRHCGGECSIFPPSSPLTRRAFADFAAAAVERYGPDGDFWKPPVPPVSNDAPAPPDPEIEVLPCPFEPPLCPPLPPPPPPPSETPPPTEAPCGCTEPHPIRAWQLWNEENSPKYFAPEPDVGTYGAMVKAAGDAIHQVDPGADVVLGGMWGPASAAKVVVPVRDYLQALYQVDGVAQSFDSIALHPYAINVPKSVAQLETAHKVAKRAGDPNAGIWVTEFGWAADGPKDDPYVKGRRGQARLLAQALKTFERKRRHFGLRGVFWYSWRDRPGGDAICTWCGHAGLRSQNGAAKPAWRAFSRVATR
jgi:hypothetical protein